MKEKNIPNTCDLNFPTLKTKTNENKKLTEQQDKLVN